MYSFLVKIYTFVPFGKYHNVHQLLFRTRCFALRKFSMLDGSPMDIRRRRNEGGKIPRAPNHYGGRPYCGRTESLRGAGKSQQFHK